MSLSGPVPRGTDPESATRTFAPGEEPTREYSPGSGSPSTPAASSPGSARTPGRLSPGERLGNRYEIVSILGEGGMGTVYRAVDHELGRDVALKIIRPDMAAAPEVLERFKREILLASKITHRNVLRIYDLGEAAGLRFISMNYVDGVDLKDTVRRGPLPLERALPIVRQVAEALQAAHDAGVVHRDLKPQNILMDRDGNAYIADFGISRTIESGATVTETGTILGTVNYMSPEQARGEAPDRRTDIYSLGVILYELLTGSLPFPSDNPISAMMKRIHEDAPPLRQSQPDLPPWISAVVARALARDPDARYQSAADLLRDLEQLRATTTWRMVVHRRGVRWTAAAAVVLAAAVIVIPWLRSRPTMAPAPVTSLAILPFQNATGDERFDWIRAGLPELLRSDLLQSKSLRLAGSDRVLEVLEGLHVSPDRALRRDTLSRVAELAGGEYCLTATLMRAGERFRIEASLTAPGKDDGSDSTLRVEGEGEEAIFAMVDEMTAEIRDRLGASRGLLERDVGASDLTTRSVEAIRLFSEGVSLSRQGKHLESARRLESALEQDPDFAMAHAFLAETYDRLGRSERAVAEAEKAVRGLSGISAFEAARIRAVRARLGGDLEDAEKLYRTLCGLAPHDADSLLELARVQEEGGHLEGARESLRRVLELDAKHPDAHYTLGRVELKLGNSGEALQQLNAALGFYLETGNEEGRANVLTGLGNVNEVLGRREEALRLHQEALEIRRRIGDRRGVGVALHNIGLLQFHLGRPDEAIRSLEAAISEKRDIGDSTVANSYMSLGDVHQAIGRPEQALESYRRGLERLRDSGDEVQLAASLSSVGYVNMTLGRYLEAFFFLKEALAKSRELGGKEDILRCLIDLGALELVQGRYATALEYGLEGLTLARSTGNRYAGAVVQANLASIHEDEGDYAAAEGLLAEAADAARELDDPSLTNITLAYQGNLLSKLGDYAGAEEALEEAERQAREAGNVSLLAEVGAMHGALFLSRGDRARAAQTLHQAVADADQAKDRRLQLMSGLYAAQAAASDKVLHAALDEISAAGLRPLVAPGHLALAEIHLASGRATEALAEAERAIDSAESLGQRDLAFHAHRMAALCRRQMEDEGGALDHLRAALHHLEEVRRGLDAPTVKRLLARPQTASFLDTARASFREASLDAELERIEALETP